jgi:hypothetical protein
MTPTPELVLAYIRKCEAAVGKRPNLKAVVDEFDGKYWGVMISLWELRDRGEI